MGKKKTTGLINKTDNDMEIREFRGVITDMNDYIGMTPVEANPNRITDIDTTKYSGGERYGGQPSYLMIFCNGSFLKSRSCTGGDFLFAGGELGLSGQRFIHSKTVTIDTVAEDRNVVNYKVTFEPRDASVRPLEVFSDSVLNHDNGWSVHCNNGSVKLTRKEGMTMTLDPSKLFASNIVPEPETSLLGTVLKFWPRTFADLNCKDKLGSTVCIVNYLMHQAKWYRVDKSRFEVGEVVQKVADLHQSCAAMVVWYHPLFPGMEGQFLPVAEMMAEVDREKLDRFAATIEPLLQQPKSLHGSSS